MQDPGDSDQAMAKAQPDKLRRLIDAGIALTSELSLDSLLQRIVDTSAELTEARYAALGVIDTAGRGLERFLTTGIDEETHRAIGDLPRGRGVLGVLIREVRPLRLHDIADDPRSVGFPRSHPPMRTFLGVPIVLRGVAYGNLYLTEKAGGLDFTVEDEELTQLLAAQAAVAIENARLYESSTRWLRQLEGLNEIGAALASEVELEPLLDLVARRMQELVEARLVLIALPDGQGSLCVTAAAGRADLVGMEFDPRTTKVGRVLDRGHTERVDAVVDDPEVDQRVARALGITSGDVPAADRARHADRRRRGARQARRRPALQRGGRPPCRVARGAGGDRGGPLRACQPGRPKTRRRRPGAGTRPARARAPRRDGPGADLDPARAQAPRRRVETDEAREATAAIRELVASTLQDVRRLAVELRPSALDDFGLVPPSSGWRPTFPSSPISSSTSRPGSATGASRPRRRRRCTGSSRRP